MEKKYEHKLIAINKDLTTISELCNDGWKIKGMTNIVNNEMTSDQHFVLLERITREYLEQQKKEFAEHIKKMAWEHHCIG